MYEIKFLSSKEFDNLPVEVTKGSKIDDSLGFYNPDLGRAYIRWTAYPELNKYLLEHEFEHMQEDPDHPTDVDENGIRHKKFFKELLVPLMTGGAVGFGDKGAWGINMGDISGNKKQQRADEKMAEQQQQQLEQQQQQFFNPFFQQQPMSQPSFGTPSQSNSLPESGQGGLNPGLSQQSLFQQNPQYRYGAPSGRLLF